MRLSQWQWAAGCVYGDHVIWQSVRFLLILSSYLERNSISREDMWGFPVTLFYCHIVGTPLCFKILSLLLLLFFVFC